MDKKIDINRLSVNELRALIHDAKKMIDRRLADQNKARRAAEMAALKHGFTLEDLLASAPEKSPAKRKAPPKYANPLDKSATWSGRGRQPYWFKRAMADGISPDDLKI